jgi:hypothetical protein
MARELNERECRVQRSTRSCSSGSTRLRRKAPLMKGSAPADIGTTRSADNATLIVTRASRGRSCDQGEDLGLVFRGRRPLPLQALVDFTDTGGERIAHGQELLSHTLLRRSLCVSE